MTKDLAMEQKVKKQLYKQLKRLGKLTDIAMNTMRKKQVYPVHSFEELRAVSEEMKLLAYFLINDKRD